MSFVLATAPEALATAASDLAGIGSTIGHRQCGGGGTDDRGAGVGRR